VSIFISSEPDVEILMFVFRILFSKYFAEKSKKNYLLTCLKKLKFFLSFLIYHL